MTTLMSLSSIVAATDTGLDALGKSRRHRKVLLAKRKCRKYLEGLQNQGADVCDISGQTGRATRFRALIWDEQA